MLHCCRFFTSNRHRFTRWYRLHLHVENLQTRMSNDHMLSQKFSHLFAITGIPGIWNTFHQAKCCICVPHSRTLNSSKLRLSTVQYQYRLSTRFELAHIFIYERKARALLLPHRTRLGNAAVIHHFTKLRFVSSSSSLSFVS